MCGICGILNFDKGIGIDASLLWKMTDTMDHRGPDDAGIRTGENWGVGHRRLSIIDITGGQQPMSVDEGPHELTIVFNGEIYNYLELRRELQKSGFRFKTDSDTEVVLIAYKHWGNDCVNRIEGMFSFAIWNHCEQQFFLCRDRLGIKPLYYYKGLRTMVFASEIRAILASSIVAADIEKSCLNSFLTLGYSPSPKTMFKGIFKLLPGHAMTVASNGTLKAWPYWSFDQIPITDLDFTDAKKKLGDLLRESVKMRLMSEVPLGVFLSGGLDSSAITAIMSRISGQKIKTFSVGYENADSTNELPFAGKVANLFGTEHHEFILKPFHFLDSIPQMVEIAEEPLVETPAIPLYQIAKAAKPHATVLLSGEGSDEVFGGYGLYRKMLQMEKGFRYPVVGTKKLFPIMHNIPQAFLPGDRLKKYMDWISNPLENRYRGTSADVTNRIRRSFYARDFLLYLQKKPYLDDRFNSWFKDVAHRDVLSKMLYVDSKTWLPDDLLLKADKMTMAASIELRVPFLDHKIVTFAASLPAHYKIYKGEGKFILKKLMEGVLPKDIIYRKKKGFTVPTQQWFTGKLLKPARDIIMSEKLMNRGWFQKGYLETMFDRHSRGREDYSRRIFSLLVLYHWLDIHRI